MAIHTQRNTEQNTPSDQVRTLSHALSMADSVIGSLISAYENNDMKSVERMLGAMASRRVPTKELAVH